MRISCCSGRVFFDRANQRIPVATTSGKKQIIQSQSAIGSAVLSPLVNPSDRKNWKTKAACNWANHMIHIMAAWALEAGKLLSPIKAFRKTLNAMAIQNLFSEYTALADNISLQSSARAGH